MLEEGNRKWWRKTIDFEGVLMKKKTLGQNLVTLAFLPS